MLPLPLIAIVGRPNVGKSTLFNRLLARRRAITAATPGVTRDVVEEQLELGGRTVRMVDTGGIGAGVDTLGPAVGERALGSVAAAAVVLLVVDVTGLTAEDEELAQKLRAVSERVVVVVNKVDHDARAAAVWDFHRLGYGAVVPVSAAHGRNISTLVAELTARLAAAGGSPAVTAEPAAEADAPASGAGTGRPPVAAASPAEFRAPGTGATAAAARVLGAGEQEPAADPASRALTARTPAAGASAAGTAPSRPAGAPRRRSRGAAAGEAIRLAIVGKPNTGKSTLLNRLLGEERALVSDLPGTTRDPVVGRFEHHGTTIEVIDTAGIRRRSKVSSDVEYYAVNRAAALLREVDVAMLLVDANEGLAEQDKRIAALAIRHGVAVLVALSKWDLVAGQPNLFQAMVDRIRFQFPLLGFAPVLALSGGTGFGLDRVLAKVVELHRQLVHTVPTAKLNQALARWAQEYVPTVRGREVRVQYATQTSANPLRFVCFLNRARGAGAAYRRFLENRIRSELGFPEVPVTVEFRE